MKIDKIIDTLKNDGGAVIPRPAAADDIDECREILATAGLEPLPFGYVEFLKKCNGLAWDGIMFYGTYTVTEKGNPSGFKLPDIVTMNDDFNDRYKLDEKVLIGRADEEYYVYDIETRKYEVLDFTSREVYEEYDTFDELFSETVGGRMGVPDEYKIIDGGSFDPEHPTYGQWA